MKDLIIPTTKSIINIEVNNTEVFIKGENINYTRILFSNDIKYDTNLNTTENITALNLNQEQLVASFDYQFLKSTLLKQKKKILINKLVSIKEYQKDSQITIILPKDSRYTKIKFISENANLTINDLLYQSIFVQTKSGEIIMRDVDGLEAKIENTTGDISMQMDESVLNYNLKFKSTIGKIYKETLEEKEPEFLESLHNLEAKTVSGDVSALFLGRKNY